MLQLSDEQKELRQKYKENHYLLCKDLLGYKDLTVGFHWNLVCKKLNEQRKKSIRLWLLPRGHFKTTILTIGQGVRLQLNNPAIRIAIVSGVLANAQTMVTAIGSHYLTNDKFRLFFPDWCPVKPQAPETVWTKSNIEVPNRYSDGGLRVMENTFEAFGADSTLTSRHFDWIILDDLVTRENTTTAEQMEKIKDFFKACFPLRDNPRTPMDVVGTIWDDNDLYMDMIEGQFGEDIEVIKFPCRINGKPIFPERYPEGELKEIKKKMGTYLFSCCYELDPVPEESQIFKPKYFQYFTINPATGMIKRDDGAELPVGDCFMTIDGATEDGNDYFAIVIGMMDWQNNIYILDAWWERETCDPVKFLDKIVEKYFKWSCVKFAGQKSLIEKMLMSFLKKKMKEDKIYLQWEALGKNTKENKEFSIKKLQPWYEASTIWHNVTLEDTEFENELTRFPKAKHDDLPDCEQMLLEILRPSSKVSEVKNYDRNSIEMWKRRLKRALGKYPSEATEAYIDTRTY